MFVKTAENLLDRELRFTEVYAAHERTNPLQREIACLKVQLPGSFASIHPGDWFAGRMDLPYVGLSPEIGGLGYYCRSEELRGKLGEPGTSQSIRFEMENLLAFWRGRTTPERCRAAFPDWVRSTLPSDDYLDGEEISFPLYRIAGTCLDYQKLMRLGIPGLSTEISLRRQAASKAGETDLGFYEALQAALDLFGEVASDYAAHARDLSFRASAADRLRLETIAGSLEHILKRPPETFHQAAQLFWLYTLCSLSLEYGRMDVYLGDFLSEDLDCGSLDWTQALSMTASLWQLIQARGEVFNHRVILGGLGRPNPANADRFAHLAMETQSQVAGNLPQLSLRCHTGMDPEVWHQALELLGCGSTYPILYNDDVNVPAVAKGFSVSPEEAEQYVPFGCGEYILDHRSLGSPNGTINLAGLLNITLNDGVDPFDGRRKGLVLGSLVDFRTFDQVLAAFDRQLDAQLAALAQAQATIYRVTGQTASFPFLSLLYDDCLARGRALLQGGARYLGGTLETYGNNTAADALYALRETVYPEEVAHPLKMTPEKGEIASQKPLAMTPSVSHRSPCPAEDAGLARTSGCWQPEELLRYLKAGFAGSEAQRRRLLNLPKFGNDHPEVDGFNVAFNHHVLSLIRDQAPEAGLHTYQAVLINNYMHVAFGRKTAASADGRRAGDPLSNGYQPGAGNDRNGVTALLNSMAKLNPALHAGAVHNLKFSRKIFDRHSSEVSALLRAYFASGGTQAMITVTSRGELEEAMRHPERYPHLMVRIGGYSERFVNLPVDVQLDIIKRTLYEED